MRRLLLAAVLTLLSLPSHAGESDEAEPAGAAPRAVVRVGVEEGFLVVFHNRYRFGDGGTRSNLVTEGGEDILFPTRRYLAALDAGPHRFTALYQPLDLRTSETLRRDLVIDGTTFAEGSTVNFRYGFSFWRGGWSYDLDPGAGEIGLGAGMQIRNAAIEFRSADGSQFVSNRDVGPVPLLSMRLRRPVSEAWFVAFDADGFYAPVKYLNGGNSDVEGSILDANLRVGFVPRDWLDVQATLRYLGGGASGTSDDGYNENFLHTGAATLGGTVRF